MRSSAEPAAEVREGHHEHASADPSVDRRDRAIWVEANGRAFGGHRPEG
jgi:hypothetical protein